MNPPFAFDDDLRPELFLPPKPTRTRTRMLSDNGDRHIGNYWNSEILLPQGPLARSASSGATKLATYLPGYTDVPLVRERDAPYSPSSRTRRDSLRRDYDRDTRDYSYEDEEWDERDRTRRRRRTPGLPERSPSPMDYKMRDKLMREREREIIEREREMREREKGIMERERAREMTRRERARDDYLFPTRLNEPRENEAGEPAELDGGKESQKQEGYTTPEKPDELDGSKEPEKQEEAATLGNHSELEGGSVSGNQEEVKIKMKIRELEMFREQRRGEEEEKRQRMQAMLLMRAEQEVVEARRKKAIEDFRREQEERELKVRRAKEEAETLFEERVKAKFRDAGYSEEDAERMLKGLKDKREKEEERNSDGLGANKKTYIKVNRKYILPDTLDEHGLPWEWDEKDENFIIIKRWIPKESQDQLFEHTRRLKERKLLSGDLALGPDKHTDKIFIVRKKSPEVNRRSFMF